MKISRMVCKFEPFEDLFWPPRPKLTLKVKGHFYQFVQNWPINLCTKGQGAPSTFHARGGGAFCPHCLIFQINNPAPRVFWGVETDGGWIFTIWHPSPPGGLGVEQRRGTKMNFPILISIIMWGIKCGVYNSADSKSGWVLKIWPSHNG